MALRNQPYIPLYVMDVLTDEKLVECSAEAHGIYFRLICILHKSDEYGKLLLKQKDKQSDKQIYNFALKLLKQMPFSVDIIERGLQELLDEGVIQSDGDYLVQKRMVRDNEISLVRSQSGKKGGEKTQFASKFAKAKDEANYEYENKSEIENETDIALIPKESFIEIIDHLNLRTEKHYRHTSQVTRNLIKARLKEGFTVEQFKRVIDNQTAKWKNDQKMCEYLRPETLFNKTHFESYLNAPPTLVQAGILSTSSAGITGWADRERERLGVQNDN